MKCKNCGHDKEKHTLSIRDLHQYMEWDECDEGIKKDGATFVCDCKKFEGDTKNNER